MRLALSTPAEDRKIDYINSHGTSTVVGGRDRSRRHSPRLRQGSTPAIASTKSLTGHCLGGAGVWGDLFADHAQRRFIAASASIERTLRWIHPRS